jgi:hypothetical protein
MIIYKSRLGSRVSANCLDGYGDEDENLEQRNLGPT